MDEMRWGEKRDTWDRIGKMRREDREDGERKEGRK